MFEDISAWQLLIIVVAAFAAGFIDSIVGGGGLITIPALFSTLPNIHHATLLGTNKINAIFGTSFSAWRLTKQVKIAWSNIIPGIITALVGSAIGAWLATISSGDFFNKLLPLVLFLVLIYTIVKKDMGAKHLPNHNNQQEKLIIAIIGLTIGLYDGYFGPGTGSFFIFLFVRFLHYDFLHAATTAKILNIATNLAALIYFGWQGHIWWQVALLMAVANVGGSFFGTSVAINKGSNFIRVFFILIVSLLICKTAYDAFGR